MEVRKKIKVGNDTLGDMIEYLRAETVVGEKGSVGVDAARVVATRVFRTVYGIHWRSVEIVDVEPEDLFERFKMGIDGEKYGEYTLETYRRRLRRAFEIYNTRNKKNETMQVATEEFEREVMRLMRSINSARQSFLNVATHYLFTDEARNNYDVYAIPVEGMKPVALALPKEMKAIDANMIRGMLERMCSRVKTKKGGL